MSPANLIMLGAVVHGALYLATVAASALALHRPLALFMVLLAMGVTFLSFAAQLAAGAPLARALVQLSWVCGACAAVALFV